MNASYSSINTAKSALSSFLQLDTDTSFGKLPIVKRFMKGVFEQRPTFPRHQDIWDLKPVFDHFRSQQSVASLTLKDLSMKTTFLLCLLGGQRCQTIKLLNIEYMDILTDRYIFRVIDKVKQTRPGTHINPLEFIAYPNEDNLCDSPARTPSLQHCTNAFLSKVWLAHALRSLVQLLHSWLMTVY